MARRAKGDGALFKRQQHNATCPPPVETVLPNGKTKKVRPKHTGCKELWVGVLELPPRDGKDRKRYVYGKNQDRARNKLNEERKKLERFGDIPTASSTLETWLRYWLRAIAPGKVKPTTLPTYRTAVEKHIIPYLGSKRLDRLTVTDIREWHRALRSATKAPNRGKKTDGYSIGTIKSAHGALSSSLNDAMADGHVHQNVCKMQQPKGVPKARGHLSTAEARTLMTSSTQHRLGERWAFAVLTGSRQGERLGLRWPYVDLDEGVADISWQLQRVTYSHGCELVDVSPERWECGKSRAGSCPQRHLNIEEGWEYEQIHGALVVMRPKGKTPRLMPLIPYTVATLRQRHKAYEAERGSYATDHGLVWTHDDGRPIDRRDDYDDWRAALDAAGLPPIELHGLRHTTASLLDELGIPEGIVQEIMGHSRITTTRGYTHRDLTQSRAALARLGEALQLPAGDG